MNAEIKSLNRFEEAGFDAGQSKAMVVGIDSLLVKSFALFNHRIDAVESAMRFQMIGLIGIIVAILIGFAGLFYAILTRA